MAADGLPDRGISIICAREWNYIPLESRDRVLANDWMEFDLVQRLDRRIPELLRPKRIAWNLKGGAQVEKQLGAGSTWPGQPQEPENSSANGSFLPHGFRTDPRRLRNTTRTDHRARSKDLW